MKAKAKRTIVIRGVDVELDWDAADTGRAGIASHAVPTADLEDGTAGGPYDGEEFMVDGVHYELGPHYYWTYGDDTVCSAEIQVTVEAKTLINLSPIP
jgi:hypothetical protein